MKSRSEDSTGLLYWWNEYWYATQLHTTASDGLQLAFYAVNSESLIPGLSGVRQEPLHKPRVTGSSPVAAIELTSTYVVFRFPA